MPDFQIQRGIIAVGDYSSENHPLHGTLLSTNVGVVVDAAPQEGHATDILRGYFNPLNFNVSRWEPSPIQSTQLRGFEPPITVGLSLVANHPLKEFPKLRQGEAAFSNCLATPVLRTDNSKPRTELGLGFLTDAVSVVDDCLGVTITDTSPRVGAVHFYPAKGAISDQRETVAVRWDHALTFLKVKDPPKQAGSVVRWNPDALDAQVENIDAIIERIDRQIGDAKPQDVALLQRQREQLITLRERLKEIRRHRDSGKPVDRSIREIQAQRDALRSEFEAAATARSAAARHLQDVWQEYLRGTLPVEEGRRRLETARAEWEAANARYQAAGFNRQQYEESVTIVIFVSNTGGASAGLGAASGGIVSPDSVVNVVEAGRTLRAGVVGIANSRYEFLQQEVQSRRDAIASGQYTAEQMQDLEDQIYALEEAFARFPDEFGQGYIIGSFENEYRRILEERRAARQAAQPVRLSLGFKMSVPWGIGEGDEGLPLAFEDIGGALAEAKQLIEQPDSRGEWGVGHFIRHKGFIRPTIPLKSYIGEDYPPLNPDPEPPLDPPPDEKTGVGGGESGLEAPRDGGREINPGEIPGCWKLGGPEFDGTSFTTPEPLLSKQRIFKPVTFGVAPKRPYVPGLAVPGTKDSWSALGAGKSSVRPLRPFVYGPQTDARARLGGGRFASGAPLVPQGGISLIDPMDFNPRTTIGQAITYLSNKLNEVISLQNESSPFYQNVVTGRGLHLSNMERIPDPEYFREGDLITVRGLLYTLVRNDDNCLLWIPISHDGRAERVIGTGRVEDLLQYYHDGRFDTAEQMPRFGWCAEQQRFTLDGGELKINGSTVWHAGNDGTSSGLDADLVDGLHASATPTAGQLAPVSGTPTTNRLLKFAATGLANSLVSDSGTTLTYNGNMIWHAANDGAGSGLDADLVDGLHASTIPTAGQLTPVSGTPSTNYLPKFAATGLSNSLVSDSGTALTYNGNTVWHAGNDGSGSGLDADFLDGLSSAAFGQLAATQSWTGSNDYNTAGALRIRRGTAASEPILLAGELFSTTDTSELLIGV